MDGNGLLRELLDQVFIGSELLDNLLREGRVLSRVFASSLPNRRQVFPVDGVIDVSTEVELDGLAEGSDPVVVEVGLGLCVGGKVP